jgi:hypothetical protein
MGHDYQEALLFLRMKSSPALVQGPEGNGCVERIIRN